MNVLDWRNVGMLALIGLGIIWYVKRQASDLVTGAADGLSQLIEAANFRESDLGPGVELTSGAQLSEQDYIEMGYLERLPDGRTRITAAGEAYIESQQRVNQ